MVQRTKAAFQSTDIPTINDGGANTALETRTLLTNLSDSAAFASEMRPALLAGRWLTPMAFGGLSGSVSMTLNRIYLTPVYLPHGGNYTDFGLSTVVVTAASYKVGVYADSNGLPTGNPISGTTGTIGPFTTAAATQQVHTFGTPVNFAAGQYWLASVTDVSGTVTSVPNTAVTNIFGSTTLDSGNAIQLYVSGTYAAGLVDLTAPTYATVGGNGAFNFGLRKQ